MSAQRAFTLVELMIVVAIIGILASIAAPQFARAQYRAKRAEAPLNVDGIKAAEIAYENAGDHFLKLTPHPTGDPDKTLRSWGTGNAGFVELGWLPDGAVRGQYSVTTAATDFTVTGLIDVDDNEIDAVYTATRSIAPIFLNTDDVY